MEGESLPQYNEELMLATTLNISSSKQDGLPLKY